MDILLANYKLVFVVIIILFGVGYTAYKFITQPSESRKEQIRILLLNLVIEAEKLFGSKTGKVKFAYVYSKLIERLPYLRYVPLSVIENIVSEALDEMRHLLETNPKVAEIVKVGEK